MIKYYQSTGELHLDTGEILKGFAGAPEFINNPEAQNLKFKGPLPRGFYKMTVHPGDRDNKKAPVIVLTPCPGNEMFGRDSFLIHGGRENASQGCIIINGAHIRQKIVNRIKAGADRLEVRR